MNNTVKNQSNFINHFRALYQKSQEKREAQKTIVQKETGKTPTTKFDGLFRFFTSPGDFFNHKSRTHQKNRRKELKRRRRQHA